ncbi:hypothetical protein Z517_03790 [Fonsecaea pedrosoi CBS 271.37]|uniref:Cytochrome b5 heme-binding domain-containing protein n=1 Tax=Fonsecaea pedrosoi CBS 271.37 TaxID=1442368 RepID=A0A0D2H124_9EURO|nr:uncharacterized protein Z517_03790 [Fonsecaea pedrosoi CBS 271.37]KIW84540.1 hypothetical protein Z517_03790 [Fonsecaea pedrosoi CBS 271.37]
MSLEISREEVAQNNTTDSLWCIIDSKVYDLTDFADAHPGGSTVFQQVGGLDATVDFFNLHRLEVLQKYEKSLCIGTVKGETPQVIYPQPGDLSLVPYGEPTWLSPQFKSSYFKESHRRLQRAMRVWVETVLAPEAQEKESSGARISDATIVEMGRLGINAMRMGPGPHLKGLTLMNGAVTPEEFDYFHEMVINHELCRTGGRAFNDGNLGGMVISLPAVLYHAKPNIRKRVAEECLSGNKKICLAISEAFAGSDVAGIKTTAVKSPDGTHYIVNGTKKWITNGVFCDYFVTGVKTEKGFSVLLIERQEGLETTQIKTSYSSSAGTAFIKLDNVKVPVENLLGVEDQGFRVMMTNFNHERWMITTFSIRTSRIIVEDCIKWANQRRVFGKKLIEEPVIRQKLAKMIAYAEAIQNYLENITYQMCNMSQEEQNRHLAGPIGLFKMFATRAAHEIADEAVNVFGGRGITSTGMGRNIEMFHRTYKFDAILGGTEEILGDLGVRQAMKYMPKAML